MPTRYVIYGAGAIGGGIGGRLFQHGHDVVLIARGAHHDVIRHRGLALIDADGETTLPIPVVDHPTKIELFEDDVVVLAMKTQDTEAALRQLSAIAPPGINVACAQNGVENERLALRHFARVYGVLVLMPSTHVEPGEVRLQSYPTTGILDVGRYPSGVDHRAEAIAADLNGSTFSSRADPAVMRAKYGKLLLNLANAIEAITGERGSTTAALYARARAEAEACFAAAGIEAGTDEAEKARRGNLIVLTPDEELHGSTWQSLARANGSIETDYLNGEIVLLGRLHNIPTPANAVLQQVSNRMARHGEAPGSMSSGELAALIGS